MRPRLFAAEDSLPEFGLLTGGISFNEAAAFRRGRYQVENIYLPAPVASMRPRLFAAEDWDARRAVEARRGAASMRPRLFAAEDLDAARRTGRRSGASMRPRLFAAEDMSAAITAASRRASFNEAAAFRRGR